MSSLWQPPKEDSPSVLSNRVFSTRRLNKIESQRLGSQLNNLVAEVSQAKSLISQEQKALRKELAQIREVKGTPGVSIERRKLLQQVSSKESQICRHRSTLETQGAHKQQPHLLSLNARQRSLSTNYPPLDLRGEKLTGSLNRKLSGNLQNLNSNETHRETGIDMQSAENRKLRQRSLSTGNYPRISAWVDDKNGALDDTHTRQKNNSSTHIDGKNWQNRGKRQDHVNLELRHSPKSTPEETKRDRQYDASKKTLPEIKMYFCSRSGAVLCACDNRRAKGVVKDGLSKLALTRKVRSFSTNSSPTISDGKVVCLGDKTTSVPQLCDAACQGWRCRYRTSSTPNVDTVDAYGYQDAEKNKEAKRTVLIPRRNRSLSSNYPPEISLQGAVLESSPNERRLDSKLRTVTKNNEKFDLAGEIEERYFQQI